MTFTLRFLTDASLLQWASDSKEREEPSFKMASGLGPLPLQGRLGSGNLSQLEMFLSQELTPAFRVMCPREGGPLFHAHFHREKQGTATAHTMNFNVPASAEAQ
jgi:hypothetical protein